MTVNFIQNQLKNFLLKTSTTPNLQDYLLLQPNKVLSSDDILSYITESIGFIHHSYFLPITKSKFIALYLADNFYYLCFSSIETWQGGWQFGEGVNGYYLWKFSNESCLKQFVLHDKQFNRFYLEEQKAWLLSCINS